MILITRLIKEEQSTASWIEKELARIEGAAPTIEKVIDATLTYIGPVLVIALDAVGDPALAVVVQAIVVESQKALAVASALVHDFGPTPTAATAFSAVATNLADILAVGKITSKTTVAAITKAVSEVGVVASAVQLAANAIATVAAPAYVIARP